MNMSKSKTSLFSKDRKKSKRAQKPKEIKVKDRTDLVMQEEALEEWSLLETNQII